MSRLTTQTKTLLKKLSRRRQTLAYLRNFVSWATICESTRDGLARIAIDDDGPGLRITALGRARLARMKQ